jgi:hypothetical protein
LISFILYGFVNQQFNQDKELIKLGYQMVAVIQNGFYSGQEIKKNK